MVEPIGKSNPSNWASSYAFLKTHAFELIGGVMVGGSLVVLGLTVASVPAVTGATACAGLGSVLMLLGMGINTKRAKKDVALKTVGKCLLAAACGALLGFSTVGGVVIMLGLTHLISFSAMGTVISSAVASVYRLVFMTLAGLFVGQVLMISSINEENSDTTTNT